MQRQTYAIIDGNILKKNVMNIKKAYPSYEYYIGIVKNNAYHHGLYCVNDLIEGGVNYLAVSSLEEAIMVRKYNKVIPILCLEIIPLDFIDDVIKYNVTITIESNFYLRKLLDKDFNDIIKVHLKVDSGMHRLGFTDKDELTKAFFKIRNSNKLFLEGIYSHFATSGVLDIFYDKQVSCFLDLTSDIYLEDIPIVHFGRSLSLVQHEKLNFCNGIRLGIVMYGFNNSYDDLVSNKLRLWKVRLRQKRLGLSSTSLVNSLDVAPSFSLYSSIMSRRKVFVNDVVGYNTYFIKENGYIYTIPIGYGDGVTKSFAYVLINHHRCKIVSDCMDMILVFSTFKFDIGSKVLFFGDEREVKDVCRCLSFNAYHLFNQISNRVVRIHIRGNERKEIFY